MEYSAILLALGFLLAVIQALSTRKSRRLPPGPSALPIIGNLHLLGDQPHKSLAKLAKIHGPIMSLKLGRITTVVISSAQMAEQVLKKQDVVFSNRMPADSLRAKDHNLYSVVFLSVTPRWRNLRKILNGHIFSVNKLDANQHLRRQKVRELVVYCHKHSQRGEAVDIGAAAFQTTFNLLSNTIFSKDLADPFSDSAKEFKELVWNIMEEAGKPNIVDYFPVLEKIDPQHRRTRMKAHFEKIFDLFNGLIHERQGKTKPLNDQNSDVLDVLLNSDQEEMDRTQILHLFLDLFVAGTDTTSSTIEWAMAHALNSPEAMKKAKDELAKVVGKGKIIEETDVPHLPYLRCMVKETLRMHPAVTFLVPRGVEQDVNVCGYTVPKGTQVLVNAWAIGRDPTVWENPLEFKPERFLDSPLDVRGQDFELIPFGAGRRICPGLPLAMRILPVMLGSLLNSFNWKLEGGIAPEELDMEEKFGFTLQKANPLRAVPIPFLDS